MANKRIPVKAPDWGSYVAQPQGKISNIQGASPSLPIANAGFGPGLEVLAKASKRILGVMLTEREKKDLQAGRAAAMEDKFELRNNASDWLKKIEKEGLVANWHRPDVRQGYKTVAGILHGRSPAVKTAINEGMQPFIMDMVEQGASDAEFNAAYDARMKGVVQGVMDEVPDLMNNSFYKELGFLPEVTKQLESARNDWTQLWKAAGTAKHQETTLNFLVNLMNEGRFEMSSEWFHSGVLEDDMSLYRERQIYDILPASRAALPDPRLPESEAEEKIIADSYKGVAPSKLWSKEQKPKLAFFTAVQSSLLGPAYAGRADSPYRVQNLERSLAYLDHVRGIKPSNLNTRLDSGEMAGKYNDLEGKLVNALMSARGNAATRREAAEKGFAAKIQTPLLMLFGNEDETSPSDKKTYMYLGAKMERIPAVFDGMDSAVFLDRLFNNKILIPDAEGNLQPLIWDISKIPEDERAAVLARGWTPTPAEFEAGNKYLAFTAVQDVLTEYEAKRDALHGDQEQLREFDTKDFQRQLTQVQQMAAVLFGQKQGLGRIGGLFETWDDAEVNTIMSEILADFKREAHFNSYVIDYTGMSNEFREWASKNFGETYRETGKIEIENYALSQLLKDDSGIDGQPFWLNAGQLEIEWHITTSYPNLTREASQRLAKKFSERENSWGSLLSMEAGTRGVGYYRTFLKNSLVETNNPAVAAYFVQRERHEGVIPNALQAPTYSRAEDTYRALLEKFMKTEWRQTLNEIGLKNGYSAKAIPETFLNDLITKSTGKVELKLFNPATKEVFEKEYEETLLNKWLLEGKGPQKADGTHPYSGWVDRLMKEDAAFDARVQEGRRNR